MHSGVARRGARAVVGGLGAAGEEVLFKGSYQMAGDPQQPGHLLPLRSHSTLPLPCHMQAVGPIHHERRLHQLMLADEVQAWRELSRLQKQVSLPFPAQHAACWPGGIASEALAAAGSEGGVAGGASPATGGSSSAALGGSSSASYQHADVQRLPDQLLVTPGGTIAGKAYPAAGSTPSPLLGQRQLPAQHSATQAPLPGIASAPGTAAASGGAGGSSGGVAGFGSLLSVPGMQAAGDHYATERQSWPRCGHVEGGGASDSSPPAAAASAHHSSSAPPAAASERHPSSALGAAMEVSDAPPTPSHAGTAGAAGSEDQQQQHGALLASCPAAKAPPLRTTPFAAAAAIAADAADVPAAGVAAAAPAVVAGPMPLAALARPPRSPAMPRPPPLKLPGVCCLHGGGPAHGASNSWRPPRTPLPPCSLMHHCMRVPSWQATLARTHTHLAPLTPPCLCRRPHLASHAAAATLSTQPGAALAARRSIARPRRAARLGWRAALCNARAFFAPTHPQGATHQPCRPKDQHPVQPPVWLLAGAGGVP